MKSAPVSKKLDWAGYFLGFGLGGFFDGILLHQILQWHHLLSLVEGVGDIRNQVVFDGLFHALMYLIAAIGLFLLWQSRKEFAGPKAGLFLFANVLIGFGAWHITDSILSHWVLGIHRIKLDSPNPLLWDLIWFFVLGLVPLIIGIILRGRSDPGNVFRHGGIVAAVIAAAVLVSGPWAARSPVDNKTAIAVFRPGMSDGQIWNAVIRSGGVVMWQSRGVYAVAWNESGRANSLYRDGAMLVSNSFLGAGCLAWAKI
ncbi:DUF2243 domain-containing protein [Croceibacterium ferulae]|uniref:DUF2243 domain-containing protein n=1 Tax=Croceibacterium ferulae TaxID=1854641 RepID=UPI000EB10B08|nr:DUF2243 domain-containing protein [Croceibacterium ferulae]